MTQYLGIGVLGTLIKPQFSRMGKMKPAKGFTTTEHDIQVSCVVWFRLTQKGKLIFAIPNGGNRNIVTAKKLKAEGVLSGVPDLLVPEPCGKYHGLFIEMKNGSKGTLSDEQKKRIPELKKRGYKVVVCGSLDAFITEINNYFKGGV